MQSLKAFNNPSLNKNKKLSKSANIKASLQRVIPLYTWDSYTFRLRIILLRGPLKGIKTIIDTQSLYSEIVEASGLVASHKYSGVFYAIQDSQNPSNVYAMRYDGQSLGKTFVFSRSVESLVRLVASLILLNIWNIFFRRSIFWIICNRLKLSHQN